MRRAYALVLMLFWGVAVAQTQSAWWHQVPANVANNDGSVTLTDANGNPVGMVANPTAAVVKPNQAAVTQPPTVIVQATTGYWKDPVVNFTDLPTTGNSVGDTRMVTALGRAFSWSGTAWSPLAADQNGTMTANDFQPKNIVTAGTTCPDNGRWAMDSTGSPLFCQSGVWKDPATPQWTWIQQTQVAEFSVNGPASAFSINVASVVPAGATMVNISIEAVDGDSANGTNQCALSTGGCWPVESKVYGFDPAGNMNQVIFLNQQKNGTGIYSGAEYTGVIPVANKLIYVNKGQGVDNQTGGGMNAFVYVNGYY